MVIRKGSKDDVEILTAAEAESFPAAEAASADQFRDRLSFYADHFWLLFDDNQLISFVDGFVTDLPDLTDEMYENASMHDENGAWQMIFGVVTRPHYRGQGCAGKLLQTVIAETGRQGRKGLVLTCKEHMIPYYSKFGFINEGVSASVHGNVLWYQMRLSF